MLTRYPLLVQDSPAPSSAQTTPSHAPTPNSTYNGSSTGKPGNNGDASSAANSVKGQSSKNKKKSGGGNANKDKSAANNSNKDNNNDEEATDGDRPPTKRLKITYGRD